MLKPLIFRRPDDVPTGWNANSIPNNTYLEVGVLPDNSAPGFLPCNVRLSSHACQEGFGVVIDGCETVDYNGKQGGTCK